MQTQSNAGFSKTAKLAKVRRITANTVAPSRPAQRGKQWQRHDKRAHVSLNQTERGL